MTPAISTNVPRSTLCGCCAASLMVSTGAKHTSVCSISGAPLVAGLRREQFGEPLLEVRPRRLVHLLGELGIVVETGEPQQLGVELRLDRADRDVLAVGAPVHVVEVRAGVEQVRAPVVLVEQADCP